MGKRPRAKVEAVLHALFNPLQDQPWAHEKNFLKYCKIVRDIWKLEDQKLRGERLQATQEQKLCKKAAALTDARLAMENLAEDSDLKEKNKDVVQAAMAAA